MKANSILIRSFLLVSGLALVCPLPAEERIIQDNLAAVVPSEPGNYEVYQVDSGELVAQKFFTGQWDTLSSLTLQAYRVGQPSGPVHVELWEDNGGTPGKKVATLGSFEAGEVRAFGEIAEQGWQELAFDGVVAGLDPFSCYYVVLDPAGMTGNDDQTIYLAAGSGLFDGICYILGHRDGTWRYVGNPGFVLDLLRMRISVDDSDLPEESPGGEPIYQNLPADPPVGAACPLAPSDIAAQIIRLNEHGVVSSMTAAVFRQGNPTGVLRIEIWTEVDGKPGTKVGTLGELDVATLRSGWFDSSIWQMVTFNKPVTGLEPWGTYFLVTDPGDLMLSQGNFPCAAVAYDDEGTNGSHPLMVINPSGEWESVATVEPYYGTPEGRRARYRMTLIADPADVPVPEVSSIARSGTAVSLTWESVPFRTCRIEFSRTLREGSWDVIATGIESGGSETSHEDTDPSRLGLQNGYYRVGLEE